MCTDVLSDISVYKDLPQIEPCIIQKATGFQNILGIFYQSY